MLYLLETSTQYETYWPVICLVVGAGLCISIDLGVKDSEGKSLAVFYAAILSVVLTLVTLAMVWKGELPQGSVMVNALVVDPFALFLSAGVLIGLVISCFSALNSAEYLKASQWQTRTPLHRKAAQPRRPRCRHAYW